MSSRSRSSTTASSCRRWRRGAPSAATIPTPRPSTSSSAARASTASAISSRTPCSAFRGSASSSWRPMSAAASASRTSFIPNWCWSCGRRAAFAGRSNGSLIAPRISPARRRGATTTRGRASRSMPTDASWPSMSRRSPISAPMSPPPGRSARPARRRRPWAASMPFPSSSWMCAAPSPTRCRSTPIAAPASPKPITSSSASSTVPPPRSAAIRSSCAGATLSRRSPIGPRWGR